MKNKQPKQREYIMSNFIQASTQYHGKYDAIINGEAIPCHNLATARHLINRATLEAFESSIPKVKCAGFCSPTGQYYAVVRVETKYDVRIDCHNKTTLRAWIRDGVSILDLKRASLERKNVRSLGGWNA